MNLAYRSFVDTGDLALGECTVHYASGVGGARFWNLWFYVARATDGQPKAFCVPVIPNGDYTELGPGGRSWGLRCTSPGTWQVSPSINVLETRAVATGESAERSLWHQDAAVVGVPDGEAWIAGPP